MNNDIEIALVNCGSDVLGSRLGISVLEKTAVMVIIPAKGMQSFQFANRKEIDLFIKKLNQVKTLM